MAATPQVLIGLGVEEPAASEEGAAAAVRAAFGLEGVPYLACIGRVDDQKGTGMLWRFFRAYKQRHPGPLRLVFVGQVVDAPEASDDIVLTGMVDDDAKWALLRGAQVLRGTVAPRVLLTHGDRGAHRRHPGARERGVRRDARALRTVGGRAVVLRLRRFEAALRLLTTDGRGGRRCGPTGAATWRTTTPGR